MHPNLLEKSTQDQLGEIFLQIRSKNSFFDDKSH